ncbi:uncharacterized protein LOC144178936 [Haemaphysalis longicornis]
MQMRSRRQGPGEDVATYVYDKLRLLSACDLAWETPAARPYVLDGLADPLHAAILTVQPPDLSPPAFIRLAAELQDDTTRRLPAATTATVAPNGPSTSRKGALQPQECFSRGRPGPRNKACPAPPWPQTHYQIPPLPMVKVHIDGIGDVTALVDTGAERTAIHRGHAPDDVMKPWTQPPLRGLGGCALPVGALDLTIVTGAGRRSFTAIPVFEDLPADAILGADYLLSNDVEVRIERGQAHLCPTTI